MFGNTPLDLTPLAPMGRPDPDQLARTSARLARLQSSDPITQESARTGMASDIEQLLAAIYNLPDQKRLTAKIEKAANCYLLIVGTTLPGSNTPSGGVTNIDLTPHYLPGKLANVVARQRQAIQARNLLTAIADARCDGIDKAHHRLYAVTEMRELLHYHPAAILDDGAIMGKKFIRQHHPEIHTGHPLFDWNEGDRLPSWLTMKISMPHSVAATLPGTRLADFIALDPSLAIPPHARAAYEQVVFGELMAHDNNRLDINLEPARSLVWLPGYSEQPATKVERAYANLLAASELV